MNFEDMVKLARKGTKGIYIEKPYEVTEPWQLAWQEVKEEEFGVETTRGYNIVYCPYVPPDVGKMPSLFMRYESPFWELGDCDWRTFKKRVIGFSQTFDYVTNIFEEDLENLRKSCTEG